MLATFMRRMLDNNLDIRIAGSSVLYTGKKDNKVDFTENRTTRRICINI